MCRKHIKACQNEKPEGTAEGGDSEIEEKECEPEAKEKDEVKTEKEVEVAEKDEKEDTEKTEKEETEKEVEICEATEKVVETEVEVSFHFDF